ncbi:MAG: hypothetical protein CBB87_04800 [Micavibrio sp. TMED27]|nr:exopolysaccharide biosynthesis protein exod [Micavibrio sp.]OUT91352.1 MAG: hypothetical protein CBB87_04800 [Micavibrio sp. TMED27]|tara:strand:- start:161 stop:733 length:573 start_codon:yes stop_codon:yes gene_type:complete
MSKALTDTLQTIQDQSEGDSITFEELVEALNSRGFGALLIGPSLIAVMPTGAIPGIPSLCAILIIIIAVQMVMGRSYPWIPQRLKNISFDRKKYMNAINTSKPYTEWIDSFFHERLKFLTQDSAQRVVALLCVFLALAMIPLELVPFAAAFPAATILLFGLSLSVHDGLIASIGFGLMAISIFIVPILLN